MNSRTTRGMHHGRPFGFRTINPRKALIRTPCKIVLAALATLFALVTVSLLFSRRTSTERDVDREMEYRSSTKIKQNDSKQFPLSLPNELVFFTYSDRVTKGLCLSMLSAASNGFLLHVLGINDTYVGDVHEPKLKKLYGMKSFLSDRRALERYGLGDETVLVFADASDVLYLGSRDEALHTLQQLLGPLERGIILISGERNCWPFVHYDKELIAGGREKCEEFPHRNSSFRFLNAGAYAGAIKPMRAFLKTLHAGILSNVSDDQLVFQELYSKQVREGRHELFELVIDHASKMFQTGHLTSLEGAGTFDEPVPMDAYFNASIGRVVNSESETRPFLVHFNGGKSAFVPLAKKFGLLQSNVTQLLQPDLMSTYRSRHVWFKEKCESGVTVYQQ